MGDILKFPSQQVQGLAFLDRELRQLLAAKGADEKLIDFAAGELTRMYAQLAKAEQYSFSVERPPNLDKEQGAQLYQQIHAGLEGLRKENHGLMVQLLAQLVLAQVKLFQHERPD
ncbi:MAG: hypothetical protein R3E64_13170 [Halioglobus sp.]